jgi:hypothetical protein
MIVTENECVGCPPDMGCIGTSCPYLNVTRFYCDECDDEAELYWFDDEQLCIDCIIQRLERVEIDD